jgi:hypothetical protein
MVVARTLPEFELRRTINRFLKSDPGGQPIDEWLGDRELKAQMEQEREERRLLERRMAEQRNATSEVTVMAKKAQTKKPAPTPPAPRIGLARPENWGPDKPVKPAKQATREAAPRAEKRAPVKKQREAPALGTTYHAKWKGRAYTMVVTGADNALLYRTGGLDFKTPSGAAHSITKGPVNGYVFWHMDKPAEGQS